MVARHNGRLDNAHFTNRCSDLDVFGDSLFLMRGDELEWLNMGDRTRSLCFLETPSSPLMLRLCVPCKACAPTSSACGKVYGEGVEPLGPQ